MMIGEERIREILKKPVLKDGLQSYRYIMERLYQTDVSADREFQSAFRNFYQMKRFYSDEFAGHYFKLMEQLKNSRDMSFVMALERVKHIRNAYEMSFSSKMAHTINPLHPIWDSVVTKKHFGISVPYAKKDREEACCKKYDIYEDRFYDYMASEEGMKVIHLFDEYFPELGITDVKKIDFVLWQDR